MVAIASEAPRLAHARTTLAAAAQMADIAHALAVQRGARSVRAQLERAGERVRAPARIAVVGERSRGKSLLINALLGARLMPIALDVATNAYVEVQAPPDDAGPDDAPVTVHFADGREVQTALAELRLYATEQGNPGNRLGVSHVVVRHEHPLLCGGTCLADTPGVGGLSSAHGAATSQAVGEADGVVMVLDARRPITDGEIDFLRGAIGDGRLATIVFNKAEMAPEAGASVAFAREALKRRAPALAGAVMVPFSAQLAMEAAELAGEDPEESAALARDANLGALLAALEDGPIAAVVRERTRTLASNVAFALEELARPDRSALLVLDGHTDAREALLDARETLERLRMTSARVEVAQRMVRAERDVEAATRARVARLRDTLSDRIQRSAKQELPALTQECAVARQRTWTDACAELDAQAAAAIADAALTLGVDRDAGVEAPGPEPAPSVASDGPVPPARARAGPQRWAKWVIAGASVVVAAATAQPYIALAGVGGVADREMQQSQASGRQQAQMHVDRLVRDAAVDLSNLVARRAALWQSAAVAALEPLHRARLESAYAAVDALDQDADPAGPRNRLIHYDGLRAYLDDLQHALDVAEERAT